MRGDAEPGFVVESDKDGRMKSHDEQRRENEALGNRISKLSAASLRISESLDVRTIR